MSGNIFLNIITLFSVAGLGVFTLLKDWDKHQNNFRRMAVLVLIVVVLVVGLANTWISNKKAQRAETKRVADNAAYEEQIKQLRESIDRQQQARQNETAVFVDKLSGIYNEVGSLRTDERTKQLKQQIVSLQESLKTSDEVLAAAAKQGSQSASYGNLRSRCQDLQSQLQAFVSDRDQQWDQHYPKPVTMEDAMTWNRSTDRIFRLKFYDKVIAVRKEAAEKSFRDNELDEVLDDIAKNDNDTRLPESIRLITVPNVQIIGERLAVLCGMLPEK
jgi:hypothetical protein